MNSPDSSPNFDWLNRSSEKLRHPEEETDSSAHRQPEPPHVPGLDPKEIEAAGQPTPLKEAASPPVIDHALSDDGNVDLPELKSEGTEPFSQSTLDPGKLPPRSSFHESGVLPPSKPPEYFVSAGIVPLQSDPAFPVFPEALEANAEFSSPQESQQTQDEADGQDVVHPAHDPSVGSFLHQSPFEIPAEDLEEQHVVSSSVPEHGDDPSPTTVFRTDQLAEATEDEPSLMTSGSGTVFDDADREKESTSLSFVRTEVLKEEDFRKARESWPVMDTMASPVPTVPLQTSLWNAPVAEAQASSESIPAASVVAPVTSRAFVLLASYASAITIVLICLILKQIYDAGHPHQLESLPDVAPQGARELSYAPPNMRLPPGHTLKLGESQRFGNILVEPLEIIQEPASFVHYSGDKSRVKAPTGDVWKLRIRLTNVSEDQEIAPLDRPLVLRWVARKGQTQEFSNFYITPQGTTDRQAPTVQLYRLPENSDWDIAGQDLGKVLKPGESYETVLASAEEGRTELPEQLVWRVQMRKGYSPQGNGVTTIFQVAFRKSDVVPGA